MNEIRLSDDLHQIEFEINRYKKTAGESIWEIGRRLNHVKEKNLVHGQFAGWLEDQGIHVREAQRMMKVAKELPKTTTLSYLGETALYLLSTLPEKEKEEQFEKIEAGDTPTVKELRTLTKELREKEQEIESLTNQVNQLSAQPKPKPIVETKEVLKEVKPADYDSLKTDNKQLAERLKEVESNLKYTQQKYSLLEESTQEAKELEATIRRMKGEKNRFEAMFSLNDKTQAINDFFDKEMAAVRFKPLVDIVQSEKAFNDLRDTVNVVDQWVEEMQRILPDRYIREAETIE
ncbi:DUF3102 domain-containing protein [Aerococcus kribbianus]|uniref:DUF3102 domain-containing protein n=1 Tax=Aerococcus kribbianus TaxID=2999064 RepID=A0A9X3JH13_9LACT|nr:MULTISPECIES: DUF3102 domain-containing protein [unclassified Aerococcus]MCZ0717862.1 DUF3102 domain-containing protein [Aerococcus sp. YH-aer221]MCZ0726149.1 DUF3102 domain-containing protein [Aerococcus sp. YH-aer222]